MLGRGPSWGGCGFSASIRGSDSIGFRTTPAAAADCCLSLLVQGGELSWVVSGTACAGSYFHPAITYGSA